MKALKKAKKDSLKEEEDSLKKEEDSLKKEDKLNSANLKSWESSA